MSAAGDRLGLESIDEVVRSIEADPDVRVAGRVALARISVDLDLPRPGYARP